ncbi:hypothetical protein [Sulfurimonas sp.]
MLNKDKYAEQFMKIMTYKKNLQYATLVREASTLIESLFRELISEYMAQLDFITRKKLFEAEAEIGKGNKGLENFTMGELLGVIKKSDFISSISKILNQNPKIVNLSNLNTLIEIRNACIHNEYEPKPYEGELFISTMNVLFTFFNIEVDTIPEESSPKTLTDVSKMLEANFVSVEIIEGSGLFYSNMTKKIMNSKIDSVDVTYFPLHIPIQETSDVALEYWKQINTKVLNGNLVLRRVLTLGDIKKIQWILFNLIPSYGSQFDNNFIIAYFESSIDGEAIHIPLMNIALISSRENPELSEAWLYQWDKFGEQNFIRLQGKAGFQLLDICIIIFIEVQKE